MTELFEVKCKKCGSHNIEIRIAVSTQNIEVQNEIVIECLDCGDREVLDD